MSDQSPTTQHDPNPDPSADQMVGNVPDQVEDEQAQGFVGVKVDPRPNTDYSMEGGAPGTTGQPGAPDGGPTTDQENQ